MKAPLAIDLDNVSVSYTARRQVLQGASLQLPQGGILGLIGPNGAGKSTVLRLLLGLLEPQVGQVRVLGESPRKARSQVGYVPQSLAIERDLPASLLDMILTGFLGLRSLGGRTRPAELELAHRWAERLRISPLLGRRLSELSGGQLQLGLVARALVREPQLLLLDEPTANADARAEGTVFALLEEIARDRTVVVVSHDIGVLSRSVTSIACVGAGRVVYHGDTEVPTDALEEAYGCPVELIAHGHPHRVLAHHEGDGCGHDHGASK